MGDFGMPAAIAVGGIKLQVPEEDAQRAVDILSTDRSEDVE